MIRLNRHGDTLVEVMMALAVLSAILAGAYVSASNSLKVGRQAQERAEATKVAENQLERIKLQSNGTNPAVIFIPQAFCVDGGNNVRTMPGIVTPLGDVTAAILAAPSPYATGCLFDNRYYTSVVYDATNTQFTTQVRWDRIGGGREEVRLVYRVHQP